MCLGVRSPVCNRGPVVCMMWHVESVLATFTVFIMDTIDARGRCQYMIPVACCVAYPVNMPLCASTGPVLGRCWQHQPSAGPVLTCTGMFIVAVRRSRGLFEGSFFALSVNTQLEKSIISPLENRQK